MATNTAHIHSLRERVDTINLTVAGLQKEFSRVEKDLKSLVTETNELKASVISLNKDVEEGKANFEKSNEEHDKEINTLRLQLLNYEVYQRRENLRFYGISEEGESDDTKETLYKLLENRLKMDNVWTIEFQRVNRLGERRQEEQAKTYYSVFSSLHRSRSGLLTSSYPR